MSYEKALQAAGAEVLAFENFGSYQGDWWAKVRYEGTEAWVHGYYGSCSGCDAFEAEFGWKEGRCEEHKWDGDAATGCDACTEAEKQYEVRLAAFGKEYLGDTKTQQEAEAKAAENLEWDGDAGQMLAWLRTNAIGG